MDPPETPRRPVEETLHGETILDPYRWLEGDDDEVAAWTDAQNAHADLVLDLPAVDAVADRLEDVARVADYGPVTPRYGRYFDTVRAPTQDQAVLRVREAPTAAGTVLVDPNERASEGTVSLDWYTPSPDGDLVAYGLGAGGEEQYDIRVLDVDAGTEIDRVPDAGRTGGERGLAWTDDGFYYVETAGPGDGGQLEKAVRFHELGTDPGEDRLVTDDIDARTWPRLATDGDDLVVTLSLGWDRSDVLALRADPTADDLALTPVLTDYDAAFEPTLDDGTLFLRTDYEAPYLRVLAVDIDEALDGDLAPEDCREVIPDGDATLKDLAVPGDRLLVHAHEDAASVVEIHERSGAHIGTLSLPRFCTVSGIEGADDGEVAFLQVEEFDRPRRVCRADLADGAVETLREPDVAPEAELTVCQTWFESADGTDVPAFVVHRSDLEPGPETPTVLTGYGGFRVNRTPTFDRFRLPWLDAGGVYVVATLRGGTEFGESWHEQGRREHKENVFDDAIAVAEGLCDRGLTDPAHLGIRGGSNGGLLVGALLTRRPDLFGAAVCRVPLLDMLRFHRFLLGESWTVEYGHPEEPDAFEYLREYSPYHNVADRAYPPTLFTTAVGDTRVHPSHARKMTARLQARQQGDAPVALRTRDDTGHGVGKPVWLQIEEAAELWGFLAHHLDLSL